MAIQPGSPSYAAQIAAGATALTEAWDASANHSQNHFMLGHIEQWLFAGLAGLDIDFSRSPRNAIKIAPQPLPGVTWASASHICPLGLVSAAWTLSASKIKLSVDLPPNCTAQIDLPNRPHHPIRIGSGRTTISSQI
jgi:hypothetical protein